MIDDELLQELLGKASGFYNNGEYQSAIEAWKEALQVDPGSQKAREGIQMATLLLAGCEGVVEVPEPPEPAPADDGARPAIERLSRAELDILLDQGINRVRGLLDERKYSEAVEGARQLVPMGPDSEEVQRLVEEAQQAFEAAPFIEEHLTLARELASQERFEEAETECRKVFALDRAHPEAHSLIAELRRARTDRPAATAAGPPEELGGMTVKMDLSQLAAAPPAPGSGEPEPPEPEIGKRGVPASELPGFEPPSGQAAGPEPPASPDPDAPPSGAPAAGEEPLADPLSADLFDFDLDLGAPEHAAGAPAMAGTPGPEESAAAPAAPAETGPEAEVETVDADTVVPPSVRLVPRTGEEAPGAEDWLQKLGDSDLVPAAPGGPGEEAAPALETGGAHGTGASGWERELESLNLKSGEHDILGRSAARAPAASPPGIDSDLSSLMEEGLGLQPEAQGAPEERPPEDPPAPSRAEDVLRVAPRARTSRHERSDEAPPPRTGSRQVVPVYFGLLGVVLLAGGGTVWWFFFQPKTATGSVPSAVTPPSASSGEKPGPDHGPIPTPIGSTSRDPVKPSPAGRDSAGVVPAGVAMGEAPAPDPGEAPPGPAPPPRPMTPEEARSQVIRHMSEGRKFLAAEKWREARDEFAAALALDPVNFDSKELLDQAQERFDQEIKVRRDLDEAKSAFEEKSYQNALWKLYRLPRDPRLGDVDLYIRNAWFNWAVLGLKGGDATNAAQKLAEVLSADPNDAEAEKLQEVATRYASRPKDQLYYSYVESLEYRAFDQR